MFSVWNIVLRNFSYHMVCEDRSKTLKGCEPPLLPSRRLSDLGVRSEASGESEARGVSYCFNRLR